MILRSYRKAVFRILTPFVNKKSENRSAVLVDPGFEDLQLNSGKFQKIMKNLEYWKTIFKTETGQIRIAEIPNRAIL